MVVRIGVSLSYTFWLPTPSLFSLPSQVPSILLSLTIAWVLNVQIEMILPPCIWPTLWGSVMIRSHIDYERYKGWQKFSTYILFFSGPSYFSGLGSPFGDIWITDNKSSIALYFIAYFNANIESCFIFLCLNFNIMFTLLLILIMLVACLLQKLSLFLFTYSRTSRN